MPLWANLQIVGVSNGQAVGEFGVLARPWRFLWSLQRALHAFSIAKSLYWLWTSVFFLSLFADSFLLSSKSNQLWLSGHRIAPFVRGEMFRYLLLFPLETTWDSRCSVDKKTWHITWRSPVTFTTSIPAALRMCSLWSCFIVSFNCLVWGFFLSPCSYEKTWNLSLQVVVGNVLLGGLLD